MVSSFYYQRKVFDNTNTAILPMLVLQAEYHLYFSEIELELLFK